MMGLKRAIKEFLWPDVGHGNSRNRDAWVEKTLKAVPPGSRLLDAGAGTQCYRKFCDHLQYVSQDFGQYDGQGDATGLQTGDFPYGKLDIVCDICSIPEPPASFDAILCTEVFEHLPNPVEAVREFSRLLKPDGILICTAPFCSLTHFAPYHFATGFNRYWYEKHFADFGFSMVEMTPSGNYFEYIAQEIHRVPDTAQRYSQLRPTLLENFAMNVVNRMLHRFSIADSNSSEFLCYGYHVVARRNR